MNWNPFKKKLDFSFTYPYSIDSESKRIEIIKNLEKGILLEDSKIFLNWEMSFTELEPHCEKIEDSGDRVNYYLGEHIILDGLKCHLTVMRWIDKPKSNPFSQVDFFLGFDSIAIKNLIEIACHVEKIIGKPTSKENWTEEEMMIEWKFPKSNITLITWERFAIHGALHVGKNDNRNRI